jgi:hypothetical protein
MSALPRETIIVYERGFSPMDGYQHGAGVIPLSRPDEMEAAIAGLLAERMEKMRERERQEMCAKVQRGGFLAWLHEHDKAATVALTPLVILGMAWIAEQRLAGAF